MSIDHERLSTAVGRVRDDLEARFPDETFDLKPYYAGMGYCGLKIVVTRKELMSEVEEFYLSKHKRTFAKYNVTADVDPAKFMPGEVRIVGARGSFNPCE